MGDDSEKNKQRGMHWDDIDPALIEFVKTPISERTDSGGLPMPEEMLRNRREWEKFLKEHPQSAAPSLISEEPPAKPVDGLGPERLIGPTNPDHPHVNRKPGGREPA